MKAETVEILTRLLKERSGFLLSAGKEYLLETRLLPLAQQYGFAGVDELARAVCCRGNDTLISEIAEAMTTNETSFFRDAAPFESFREVVLPYLCDARPPHLKLRIWSAACSSGQEPYSLAMILHGETDRLGARPVELLATDISARAVARAREGRFSDIEVQRGLPAEYRSKYFRNVGDKWCIDSHLCSMVRFVPFNLLHDPSPFGAFDVVFCRNVLIYFDRDTKARVLRSIRRVLRDDGFLFLGGVETVLGITDDFVGVPGRSSLYRASGEAAASDRLGKPAAAAVNG